MAAPTFREYFAATHVNPGLSEREKMFIGLAVTMSRGCEPCSHGRMQKALDGGVSKQDLDAVIDLVAAINAGVVQAIARRGYEHQVETCPSCVTERA